MAKFNVDDRVGASWNENEEEFGHLSFQGEYDEGPAFGTVKQILKGTKVKVLWDDEWYNDIQYTYHSKTGEVSNTIVSPVSVDTKFLLSEQDAKQKHSELEKDYKLVTKSVKAKMEEAAKAVKEAHKLAKDAGFKSLNEMYEACSPLENAMGSAGWQTSAWYC